MTGVEPAGQGAEGGEDELGLRRDEAAARDQAPAMADPELGVEMAGELGPLLGGIGLVAQKQAVDLGLARDGAAARVGEAGIRDCR